MSDQKGKPVMPRRLTLTITEIDSDSFDVELSGASTRSVTVDRRTLSLVKVLGRTLFGFCTRLINSSEVEDIVEETNSEEIQNG